MKYKENDFIKIIDLETQSVIGAGKINSLKRQNLVSIDYKHHFKIENSYKYQVFKDVSCEYVSLKIPSGYIIALYSDFDEKEADIYYEYDINELDKEVQRLVVALNRIPDLVTKGSCSGHDELPLWITFFTNYLNVVSFLKQCLVKFNLPFIILSEKEDPNILNDTKETQGYTLKSLDIGENAYKAADRLAKYLEVLY